MKILLSSVTGSTFKQVFLVSLERFNKTLAHWLVVQDTFGIYCAVVRSNTDIRSDSASYFYYFPGAE